MSQPTLSLIVEVARKEMAAEDIAVFELTDPHGRQLPAFSAGAHIDVRVSDDIIRQYSLCNRSETPYSYWIGVLKDPESRGGSVAMHDSLEPGDLLQISAPKNHFPLEPAPHSLLFAGGIGITPILCMAEHLAHGASDFTLHYCTRSRTRTAFAEHLETSAFSSRVHFHFDDQLETQLNLVETLRDAPDNSHVYVCGPKGFIDAVLAACREQGWEESRLHCEYFAGATTSSDDDGSFEVVIASSGDCYSVPADKTVHQVLEENGVEIMVSCEQGVCGTCLTGVLEGTPDHRDLYLDDSEHAANDQFTPCCSRARSPRLVLDL
ncbi:PDR/VanB family oxidoreductase [Halomonas binhaiensis]|uniref:Oxidoreductase n=1 Tax=Halomonas binhaiensis TaxID=2562282 RepID=A0A5C1NNK1_9GAMM|nr:PDR/VanB family oxidoreductase [Halomonas binhaiensis]QEM83765.1 oxidoreductase [Halomonas binhaiensis]